MKRHLCLSGLTLTWALLWCGHAVAGPNAAEEARIDKLIQAVGQRGSVSTTSGEIYKVRMSDGRVISSSEFLRLELERIERPR